MWCPSAIAGQPKPDLVGDGSVARAAVLQAPAPGAAVHRQPIGDVSAERPRLMIRVRSSRQMSSRNLIPSHPAVTGSGMPGKRQAMLRSIEVSAG